MKKISTSALAKHLKTDWKELIKLLEENSYIEIKNKSLFWSEKIKVLTEKWEKSGWELKTWTKFWDYIVWPESFNPFKSLNISNIEYLSVSNLAENFWLWARRMNQIISELWWIERNIKWWKLTKFWESIWWKELVISKTWATYTKWPKDIIENKSLLSSLWVKLNNNNVNQNKEIKTPKVIDDYKKKYPAETRTKDWHYVRSRWEALIDNALYDYWLPHAYERRVPIWEEVLSDFYIPAWKWHPSIWIEYWGIENQKKYENRKKIKQEIYEKNHFNLIEIENEHIDNLDDYLPRELLKYWIKVD